MITMMKILIAMMTANFLMGETNPVKMSMMLVLLSGVLMTMMSLSTSASWFPMIFYLLFMGGILMMFMILSSVMPNEAMKKNKKYYFMLAIIMTSPLMMNNWNMVFSSKELKMSLYLNYNFLMITIMIVTYFLIFIYLISKNKVSMRSVVCYKMINFVS